MHSEIIGCNVDAAGVVPSDSLLSGDRNASEFYFTPTVTGLNTVGTVYISQVISRDALNPESGPTVTDVLGCTDITCHQTESMG